MIDKDTENCFHEDTKKIEVGKYGHCDRRPYGRNQKTKESKRQGHHRLWWCLI